MDFAELKAKLDRSREFELQIEGVKFRLRLPTDHHWRVITEQNTDASGRVARQAVSRVLLDAAVTGWEGLTAEHLLKGGGADAVAFSADTRAALLDERQDLADELVLELIRRLNQRRKEMGDARKNSSRASSGT
jgi:hypothetical protein